MTKKYTASSFVPKAVYFTALFNDQFAAVYRPDRFEDCISLLCFHIVHFCFRVVLPDINARYITRAARELAFHDTQWGFAPSLNNLYVGIPCFENKNSYHFFHIINLLFVYNFRFSSHL